MEAKIIVVIPVYKQVADLNEYEKRSIANCVKKLAELDICFAGPGNLEAQYKAIYKEIFYQSFKASFFEGIKGYNHLLKAPVFYRRFSSYTHLLIVQTDAWIFGDATKLNKFTKWDFAGAPSVLNGKLRGYNGGLSLRNISSCRKVLTRFRYFIPPGEIIKRHTDNQSLLSILTKKWISILLDLTVRNNFMYPLNRFVHDNEDIFWSSFVASRYSEFKVISYEEALKFSWEHDLEKLNSLYSLPFGIHGWWNYNLQFWKSTLSFPLKTEMGISEEVI